MTPSASSRWMRFQHGVDDSPTRLPISATDREASPCRRVRILRSVTSILGRRSLEGAFIREGLERKIFQKRRTKSIYRELITISRGAGSQQRIHLGAPGSA